MLRVLGRLSVLSLGVVACGNSSDGDTGTDVQASPTGTDSSTGAQPVNPTPTGPVTTPKPTTTPAGNTNGPTPTTPVGPTPNQPMNAGGGPGNTTPPGPMPNNPPPGPAAGGAGGGGGETPPGPTPGPTPTGTGTGGGVNPGPTPDTTGTGPATPNGPPDGAYVACSGDAPPKLKLTTIIEDVDVPIYATTPEKDPNTMFVVSRSGDLRRYDLTQDPPTFVSLVSLNTSVANECGFFSVAIHPNYDGDTEKRIYLSYMPTCPGSIFSAGGSSSLDEYIVDGDTATLSKNLFMIDQPQGNHNGGLVKFGPDGFLYFGLGDGGGGNDTQGHNMPNGNAQDVTTPLGKMLRFDVDNPDTPPGGNLTAADVGSPNGFDGRIYHWGLRNPFRWSFDRLTGDLYIGDVGQDTCEEVDVLPADSGPTNFGWSSREGTIACPGCGGHTIFPDGSTAHEPIFTYPTDKTKGMDQGCSKPLSVGGATNGAVIGGYVYRGSKIPGMYGRYIFTDFERKTGSRAPIFALTAGPDGKMCDFVEDLIPSAQFPDQSVPSFAEDSNGELYVINMTRGEISRIDPE